MPGPIETIRLAMKISTVGNSILIGSLPAASSARRIRFTRISSEWTRSVSARLVPNRSVCTSMATSELTSETPVRVARPRRESVFDFP